MNYHTNFLSFIVECFKNIPGDFVTGAIISISLFIIRILLTKLGIVSKELFRKAQLIFFSPNLAASDTILIRSPKFKQQSANNHTHSTPLQNNETDNRSFILLSFFSFIILVYLAKLAQQYAEQIQMFFIIYGSIPLYISILIFIIAIITNKIHSASLYLFIFGGFISMFTLKFGSDFSTYISHLKFDNIYDLKTPSNLINLIGFLYIALQQTIPYFMILRVISVAIYRGTSNSSNFQIPISKYIAKTDVFENPFYMLVMTALVSLFSYALLSGWISSLLTT